MVIRSVRSGSASAQAERPNYKRARAVLGADFLTPEEVIATRGIFYDDEQLKALDGGFPTDEEIVRLQKTGCLLMPNPSCPLGLVLVRALNTELFFMRDDAGWNEYFSP